MILISSSNNDNSTNAVIDWIFYFNKDSKIVRINDDEDYDILFEANDIKLVLKTEIINFNSIKSFWYRRGRIRYKINNKNLFSQVKESEESVLEEYIHFILSKKRHISKYHNSEPNKLIVLELAKKIGLNIPQTYIYEKAHALIESDKKDELITKTILPTSMMGFQDATAIIYTTLVKDISVSEKFLPSLFQKKISKKYELRIFYFKGVFWTMAIFLQSDSKTKLDFKEYNEEHPNRNVPYNLPCDIKTKLEKLMMELDLDTGSIDMIVTPENEFVFLEINPIGQFGMVSIPCNYNVEKEIAKYLNDED